MWIFSGKSANGGGASTTSSVLGSHDDPLSSFTLLPPRVTESLSGPYDLHWSRQSAAHRKIPSDRVTVFFCDNTSPRVAEAVTQTIKRMKTLRHPNILTWMAGNETSSPKLPFCIITEEVRPLVDYLKEQADASGNFTKLASWGIYQITRALKFLNDDCQLTHNAVCASAVYVNRSGEWKLGRLDYVTSPSEAMEIKMNIHRQAAYCAPSDHCVDAWGLACLIWEIFNPEPLTEASQLGAKSALERLPKNLVASYRRLLSIRAPMVASKTRSPFSAFLKVGFFRNDYIDTLLFLEEIQLKDMNEKAEFLAGLGQRAVGLFPDDICRYKILPHLVQSVRYGSIGVEALVPVLELSHLLPDSDFEVVVVPALVRLFAAPDRATRVRLLDQLPKFVDKLPSKLAESQIFPPVAAGFTDANPLVREATIKAMVHLAPILPSRILNDAVLRHLTALEFKDDQGGIRTNATICLAKLAAHMEPGIRRGPLLNALLRATRDTFPPSRQAAVTGLAACQAFFSAQEIAGKVIPCLSFIAVDTEKDIRDIALKALRGMIERLEKTSDDPTVGEANTSVLGVSVRGSAVTGSVAAAGEKLASAGASIGNWALTALYSLSSHLITSSSASGRTSIQQASSQPAAASGAPASIQQKSLSPTSSTFSKKPGASLKMTEWGDEEAEDVNGGLKISNTPKQKPASSAWDDISDNDMANEDSAAGWGSEHEAINLDLASLSVTIPKTSSSPSQSSKPLHQDLFIDWDEPASSSQHPKSSISSRSTAGQDDPLASWGESASPLKSKPKLPADWNSGSQQLKASSLSPTIGKRKEADSKIGGGSGVWQRTPAPSTERDFFKELLGSTSSKASSIASSRLSPAMKPKSTTPARKPAPVAKLNEDDDWGAW